MILAKWTCAFLVLGFLIATHSLAAQPPAIESRDGKPAGNHFSLWQYYEQQAQLNESKAQKWDFVADYYEKFPAAFAGKMSIKDHIAQCRAIAEDLRMAANKDHELASQHFSMMRKDVIP